MTCVEGIGVTLTWLSVGTVAVYGDEWKPQSPPHL